jgi:hypothetical protein
VFLSVTLVLAVASAISPERVDWKLPAITGGMSLAQFLGAFFTQPTGDLQRNLTNLATFKMILESHSLKTAFARFHLTTPQMLRELRTEREATAAARQVEALERQLAVIQALDHGDFESLRELGFRVAGAPPDEVAVAGNGQALAPVESSAPAPPTP